MEKGVNWEETRGAPIVLAMLYSFNWVYDVHY